MSEAALGSTLPARPRAQRPLLLCLSHLRWDFVFQRPQHLLSRLAQHYPVLFVEEPVYDDGAPFMERSSPAPNVTVCRAHTPIHANGFHDEQLRLLQPMVAQLAPPGEEVVAWFYTPMALPLLQSLRPALVVYDSCSQVRFEQNAFFGNLTPLALSGRRTDTRFDGNYWSGNDVPDLDGDGVSDRPFHLGSLFDHLRGNLTAADLMVHSPAAVALAAAERAFPVLELSRAVDRAPLAHPPAH